MTESMDNPSGSQKPHEHEESGGPVMTGDWNPELYLRHGSHRSRPFFELVARIDSHDPSLVVDLGCGTGHLTRTLCRRWPGAEVIGVDSSAAMLERAQAEDDPAVGAANPRWILGDLRTFHAEQPIDVIVSNAALQWIPQHQELLPALVQQLAPGGWLAYQVPINWNTPVHRLLREIGHRPAYAEHLQGVDRVTMQPTEDALIRLSGLGLRVDAWETTYLHILTGPDPVFDWISGTGARPTLERLPEPLRSQFVTEYKQALREAYPTYDFGTPIRFPRAFVVAQKR